MAHSSFHCHSLSPLQPSHSILHRQCHLHAARYPSSMKISGESDWRLAGCCRTRRSHGVWGVRMSGRLRQLATTKSPTQIFRHRTLPPFASDNSESSDAHATEYNTPAPISDTLLLIVVSEIYSATIVLLPTYYVEIEAGLSSNTRYS